MTRLLTGLQKTLQALLVLSAIAWALDVPFWVNVSVFTEQFLIVCLGLAYGVIFAGEALTAHEKGRPPLVWLWLLGLALVAAATVKLGLEYPRMMMFAALATPPMIAVSAVFFAATLLGVWRTSGLGILCVVLVFSAYGALGHLVPGDLGSPETSPARLLVYLGLDTNGIFGIALNVACTIVIPFILFGQFLARLGAGDFFTDLASSLMGRYRGGAAKIAVTASALFGTISGSAVGNVVASGVITIPLMKRAGYRPDQAGAVEAVASTGGQLVPPVMGAAAFLMAEFLQIPYGEVMVAALFPAFLYFFAVFIQVDLLAAKADIKPMDTRELPPLRQTLRQGWHFALPFAALLYALFWLNARPEWAALVATLVLIVSTMIFGYRGRRPHVGDVTAALIETGSSVKEILAICAAAGIVIGVLNLTGLAFGLTLHLLAFSGNSLFLLILITALVGIVLGMGMPTVGVYVLLATLVAPALTRAGVPALAAHMFVMYFGLLSMVTPPVALAAFAGANLAGANPWKTSFSAVRLAWSAYVVPFLFVIAPSLLLIGTPLAVAWAVLTAVIGVWATTAAIVGWWNGHLSVPERLVGGVAGVLVLIPSGTFEGAYIGEWIGLAVLAGMLTLRLRNAPGRAAARRAPSL